MLFGVGCLVSKGVSMLTLANARDVIVLPNCGFQSQPVYFLPPQSPNTDTGRPILALPHKSECKAGSN